MNTNQCPNESHQSSGVACLTCFKAVQEERNNLRAEVERLHGLTGIRAMEIQAKEMAELRAEIADRAKERDDAIISYATCRR